ncbi:MAG: hypothetical protein ABFE07_10185 [Armatimonadia bacterium]
MLYVVLAVLFYVSTSVTQKTAAVRGLDAIGVNLALRASGTLLTIVLLATASEAWAQPHLGLAGGIGIVSGVATFVAGYTGLRALNFGSLNATWSVLRVATVLPVLASILVWGELRDVRGWQEIVTKLTGVLCLMAALVLLGRGKGREAEAGGEA